MKKYLEPNEHFLVATPEIISFNKAALTGKDLSDVEKAKQLYLAVRDKIWYSPFHISLEFEENYVHKLLERKSGHCVDKSTVLISCLRTEEIPARLGLSKVKNHLGTSKLREVLQTDVLVPHGYVEVYLNGNWIKCTPAFNSELCDKLGVDLLEWDGIQHSQFHAYEKGSTLKMEYLEDYGTFEDVPFSFIKGLMLKEYPQMFDSSNQWIN